MQSPVSSHSHAAVETTAPGLCCALTVPLASGEVWPQRTSRRSPTSAGHDFAGTSHICLPFVHTPTANGRDEYSIHKHGHSLGFCSLSCTDDEVAFHTQWWTNTCETTTAITPILWFRLFSASQRATTFAVMLFFVRFMCLRWSSLWMTSVGENTRIVRAIVERKGLFKSINYRVSYKTVAKVCFKRTCHSTAQRLALHGPQWCRNWMQH